MHEIKNKEEKSDFSVSLAVKMFTLLEIIMLDMEGKTAWHFFVLNTVEFE